MINAVVITDIFGRSPALEKLCSNLQSDSSNKINIIDPYAGQDITFTDEKEAYQYFIESGGIDGFAKKILKEVSVKKLPTRIIAFSVGASALWSISENNQLNHIKQAIGFYGSQIRHHQAINPIFHFQLYFPDREVHFSVDELQKNIAQKEKVTTIKTSYLHGFMNELSDNFDSKAYQKYMQIIVEK